MELLDIQRHSGVNPCGSTAQQRDRNLFTVQDFLVEHFYDDNTSAGFII